MIVNPPSPEIIRRGLEALANVLRSEQPGVVIEIVDLEERDHDPLTDVATAPADAAGQNDDGLEHGVEGGN